MKRRTFEVEAGATLSQTLVAELKETPAEVDRRVLAGAVYVDGRRVKDPRARLRAGSRVSVVLEAAGSSTAATRAPSSFTLEVLFEDREVLVVNKPPGLPAQPTPDGEESLLDLASRHLGRPAGLVHRLDRETSGVTVFGKSKAATSALAAAFREGRAKKEYVAVVGPGFPAQGVIDTPLQKDPSRSGRWRALDSGNGLTAVTRFERLTDGPTCQVRLVPETGRTHQLRAHLASLGFPIVGDTLYGGAPGARCLLHARRLEVDGKAWEAPMPADFPGS
ncbi:MAG: RluA family pseudouridine synthase [Myxococcaceae bacterium]|nr:RluA family pseudouridine synthase [Myxococcaceae bacterium]